MSKSERLLELLTLHEGHREVVEYFANVIDHFRVQESRHVVISVGETFEDGCVL